MSTTFLSSSSFPPICGDGARLFHILKKFQDECKVLIYTTPYTPQLQAKEGYGNIKVRKIHLGFKDLFKINKGIERLIDDKVVIYGIVPVLLFLLPTISGLKNKGVKIIVDVEDAPRYAENYPYRLFNFYMKRKYQRLFNIADKVISVSKYLRNELVHSFNINEKKIEIIPNGVDTSHFKRSKINRKILREKYNIKNDDIIFIYSGAMTNIMFPKEIISIFKLAIKKNPKIKLFLVGNSQPPEYIKDIKVCIKRLKLEKNIKYLGHFDFEKMPKILSIGDVGLVPFKKDILTDAASPLKIFEYMSMGLPVVSTNVKGIQEVIKDGYNGIIAKNDEEFISALIGISEGEKYRKLSKNAMKTAYYYSWENLARKFENTINNL